jgi:hypothetical protein
MPARNQRRPTQPWPTLAIAGSIVASYPVEAVLKKVDLGSRLVNGADGLDLSRIVNSRLILLSAELAIFLAKVVVVAVVAAALVGCAPLRHSLILV